LAVDLGQRGIECAVVERHREVGRIPKGQGLTNRSLEHFYFWNCVDELRAARLMPPGYPIRGITAYGNLMSKYATAIGGTAGGRTGEGNPYYFQSNERLPQYLTEEVLRARAAEFPNVTFLFEHTAKDIDQDENGVRVTVSSEVWPYEDEVIEADYVVGCDGSRSFVREKLGIERHGTDFDTRMVLAVFSSPELHKGLEHLGDNTTYHVVNPDLHGAWQFFGRVEVGVSWFFHAPVAKDAMPSDHDYIHSLLEQTAGFEFPVKFEHVGFWNLKIEVADTYRKDRIFIAGDAAHSHPPYGGYGLNSGLEDVTNLGWKLAYVLHGRAGDGLLDSYSEERQPIFVETGEDCIAADIRREASWLEQHSPVRDLAEFEKAWSERSGLGTGGFGDYNPQYSGSSVVWGPDDGSIGVHARHTFAAKAGYHLSPQLLSSGRNVFEELGTDFALLALDVDDSAVADFEHAARTLKIPLKVIRDSFEAGRERYEAHLAVIRPDQYVAWSEDASPPAAETLMGRVVAGN